MKLVPEINNVLNNFLQISSILLRPLAFKINDLLYTVLPFMLNFISVISPFCEFQRPNDLIMSSSFNENQA